MTTKGVTMTAEDEKLCNYLLRRCAGGEEHEAADRIFDLSADKARLTADLREYRNACEQKQEQIDSAKDVIKSLTADLAKARGRCEVCGWRWHWDFDYEQGTGEGG